VFAGEYDIRYEDTWERCQPLIQRYEDQLIFLGKLESMQAMANFYAACDVLVMPSDTECFALVQVEAMLCGTPVVMTDTPGGRVPVMETGMGKIVPRGDWEAMGAAVVDIAQNPAIYVKPRAHVEQCFSLEETVNRYEKHFRRAARMNG
jgi:glycosyltransferase involved in cell wall biosynthesis